ncbi:MAG: hypothetical protein R2764_07345 [Bacteroidales bacterium]
MGATIGQRKGNLPDMLSDAYHHPISAKVVMLATEIGIWTSYNLDEEEVIWQPDNNSLANVRVDMLQNFVEVDHTVLAGTHGRGFYHNLRLRSVNNNIRKKKIMFLKYTPTRLQEY